MSALLLAILLVHFTGPTGNGIDINSVEVSSLRDPHEVSAGHVAPHTNCLIAMNNGKFIGVRETCAEARRMLSGQLAPRQEPCVTVCGENRK
jgi:hypothetical protein